MARLFMLAVVLLATSGCSTTGSEAHINWTGSLIRITIFLISIAGVAYFLSRALNK